MRPYVLFLLAILSGLGLPAQEAPSFQPPHWKEIARKVKRPSNAFDYEALAARLLATDTTLSREELHFLYYGQIFRSEKVVYTHPIQSRLDSLWESRPTEARALIEEARRKMPASLYLLNKQYRICVELGDLACAKAAYAQIVMLVYAMRSTGNGRHEQHPIYVVSPRDEYVLLGLMGCASAAQSLLRKDGHFLDRLQLEPNEYEIEVLYFDICAPFSWLNATLSGKKWKIPCKMQHRKKKR